jgi:hypothetical protein
MRFHQPTMWGAGCTSVFRRGARSVAAAAIAASVVSGLAVIPASASNAYAWTEVQSQSSPAGRYGAASVFNPDAGKLVIFGGDIANGGRIGSDELWEFDAIAKTWTRRNPASSTAAWPESRRFAAMTYDTLRHVVLMYGGADPYTTGDLSDLWAWNSAAGTWTQMRPAATPPVRHQSGMTFDSQRNVAVVFGGAIQGDNVVTGDTWEWNSAAGPDGTWIQTSGPASPSPRRDLRLAFDAARGRVVLFGGASMTCVSQPSGTICSDTEYNDMWEYTVGGWTEIMANNQPPVRQGEFMEYAPDLGGVLVWSGDHDANYYLQDDTWLWNGSTWTQLAATGTPPGRWWPAGGYDVRHSQAVFFGGLGNGTCSYCSDTWLGSAGVSDTTPPKLTLPSHVTINATSPGGATANFTASARDDDGSAPTVDCTPRSGSTFSIGTTTVSCSARDLAGNLAGGTFEVSVLRAADQMNNFANLLQGMPSNAVKSVAKDQQSAQSALAAGNTSTACGDLAKLITRVEGNPGGKLTSTEAAVLSAEASRISNVIGC